MHAGRGGCPECRQKTILVQAYSFTSVPIAKAIVDAKRRGLDLRVIIDKSQRTERYSGATYLVNEGTPPTSARLTNHSEVTEKFLESHALLLNSEGLKSRDEPWENLNLLKAFGSVLHVHLKENMLYNVGTFAWESLHIAGLASLLFKLSRNRPIPIVEQLVFNYIIRDPFFWNQTRFSDSRDGWAIQLVTTSGGIPCCIVHQYDWVDGFREIVERKYG